MVWLPVLRAGNVETAAQRESSRVADPRALHFFDTNASVGKAYASVIQLPGNIPAWDVYFVFDPQARWDEKPPAPAYWMHQLGRRAPADRWLDGGKLAEVVHGMLKSPAKGEVPRPAAMNGFRRGARFQAWLESLERKLVSTNYFASLPWLARFAGAGFCYRLSPQTSRNIASLRV